ncbi:c-type cytochrome biogenesis protein CcmI [Budvicia diplopodorum]|uniref:c-type cytochrome biogenesis protein CcmI n=1 Tax=Budvicia diplopodorum TaxID=1119056 RepID=UPI001356E9F3|nr:c-type cytochrome biogenesis protein CcmI [Budvicia diplopodorum]
MIVFWCGTALMACIILLIVWLPAVRTGKIPNSDIRKNTNIALYHRQMALADKQFGNSEKEKFLLDELKQEISISLLQNIDSSAPQLPLNSSSSRLFIIPLIMTALVLLIPSLGYGLYGQYQQSAEYSQQEHTDPFAGMNVEQIQDRVMTELQKRIRQAPNDSDAWFMLGQRYLNGNEFDNALIAFDRTEKIRGQDAELLTAKAATLYYQAGQRMTPQAKTWLNDALRLDPNHVTALMLLASDHFLNAQYQQAIDIWQSLLDSNNPKVNRVKLIEAINMARMMK